MKLRTKTNEAINITVRKRFSEVKAFHGEGMKVFIGHEIKTDFPVDLTVYCKQPGHWYILDKLTGISVIRHSAKTMHEAITDMMHIVDVYFNGSLKLYSEAIRRECNALYTNRMNYLDKRRMWRESV